MFGVELQQTDEKMNPVRYAIDAIVHCKSKAQEKLFMKGSPDSNSKLILSNSGKE